MATAESAATSKLQPRPSIIATITRGECQGNSVTVDRDEIIEMIRKIRSRRDVVDPTSDPGSFTIGRQPIGDNHLFVGNADRAISNLHLLVVPVEEDSLRISHHGRSGSVTLVMGTTRDALLPGESKHVVLPVDITLGNPASTISIRHEDPCPTIDDGPSDWEQLTAAQRTSDNQTIVASTGGGLTKLCAELKTLFSADQIIIANRDSVLASAGRKVDQPDINHLWRWYAFNGRAYRLLRNLTSISLADGCSSTLGNGIVFRLFQGGTYLYVLRRASAFSAIDRERLTRIAWYALGLNNDHPEWYPHMHLEDCEPTHIRRLVTQLALKEPALIAQGAAEGMQMMAPRIVQETGILFPRRSRKPLSANAGLDVPRRHSAVAQASQNRYYHRLTDMLELFIADQALGAAPTTRGPSA
jgi:hypothetical protein